MSIAATLLPFWLTLIAVFINMGSVFCRIILFYIFILL